MALITASAFALIGALIAGSALPSDKEVVDGIQSLGWSHEKPTISRERFSVSFSNERRLGSLQNKLIRAEVTLLGGAHRRPQAVGVELILYTDPAAPDFTSSIASADQLLAVIGLPGQARAAAIELLKQRAAKVQDSYYPIFVSSRLPRIDGVVISARTSFSTGPGGSFGHALFQFIDARAVQLRWPTIQDVEALQPPERSTFLAGRSDVPAVLRPSVRNMSCWPAGMMRWRCHYDLVVDDWLGPNRPENDARDIFVQDAHGAWVIIKNNEQ